MDISKITGEITQLRRETEDEIITPEYLGEVLQDIADALKSGVEGNLESIEQLQQLLTDTRGKLCGVNSFTAEAAVSGSTFSGVKLTLTMKNPVSDRVPDTYLATIPQVGSAHAGVLSAAHYGLLRSALQPDSSGRLPVEKQWPALLHFRKVYTGKNDPTHVIFPVPEEQLADVGSDTTGSASYVMFDIGSNKFVHVDQVNNPDGTVTENWARKWMGSDAWGEETSAGIRPRTDCLYYCVDTGQLMVSPDGYEMVAIG